MENENFNSSKSGSENSIGVNKNKTSFDEVKKNAEAKAALGVGEAQKRKYVKSGLFSKTGKTDKPSEQNENVLPANFEWDKEKIALIGDMPFNALTAIYPEQAKLILEKQNLASSSYETFAQILTAYQIKNPLHILLAFAITQYGSALGMCAFTCIKSRRKNKSDEPKNVRTEN